MNSFSLSLFSFLVLEIVAFGPLPLDILEYINSFDFVCL